MLAELESIRRILDENRSGEWEKRVRALKKCRDLAIFACECGDDGMGEAFLAGLKGLKRQLAAQIGDLRSAVVREACEVLAEMAECLGDAFGDTIGDVVIPALLKTSAVTIQVVWESGAETMRRTLNSSRIPPAIVSAMTQCAGSRNATATRSSVAEYVGIILDRHPRSELDRSVSSLEGAIRVGLNDAQADVRRRSRKNFCILEMMYPDRARTLFAKLDVVTQKAIIEEKGEGDLAPATKSRDVYRRRSIAGKDQQQAPLQSQLQQSEQQSGTTIGGAAGTGKAQVLRARRVTSSATAIPSGSAVNASMTPSRPGRVVLNASSNNRSNTHPVQSHSQTISSITAPKALREWSARVAALETVVARARYADGPVVDTLLRSTTEYVPDPHAKVVLAALRALTELIQRGVDADVALERFPLLLARVLIRANSSNQGVRDGVRSVMSAVERRLSAESLAMTLIKVLNGCRTGKFGADLSGERALVPVLEVFTNVLSTANADSFEWKASLLEGALQCLAPLIRARTVEVRNGGIKALKEFAKLTPHGAMRLAWETLEIKDRNTILDVVPDKLKANDDVDAAFHTLLEVDDKKQSRDENDASLSNKPIRNGIDDHIEVPSSGKLKTDSITIPIKATVEPSHDVALAEETPSELSFRVTAAEPAEERGQRSTDRLLSLTIAGTTGDSATCESSWLELCDLLSNQNTLETLVDQEDLVGEICCRCALGAGRAPRTSTASVAAERALNEIVLSGQFRSFEVIAERLLQCLDSKVTCAANSQRVAAIGARLAFRKIPNGPLEEFVRQAMPNLLMLIRHTRVDVRMAGTELLAYVSVRLGDNFTKEYEERIGQVRMKLLARYVHKVR